MKRRPLSPEARAAWETPLSPEEFHRRLAAALADEEQIRANAELCRWFRRRYPTAGERLAYVRRKYAEWTRPSERVAPEAGRAAGEDKAPAGEDKAPAGEDKAPAGEDKAPDDRAPDDRAPASRSPAKGRVSGADLPIRARPTGRS